MLEKRTFILISIATGIWLIVGVFILIPNYKKMQDIQVRLESVGSNLQSLCSGNNAPHPEEVERLKKQSQQLTQQIQEGANVLGLHVSNNTSTSVVEFRGYWDAEIRLLRQQSNKLGVTIGDAIGFSQSLPSTIPTHYWTQAELASRLMSQLLLLAEPRRQLYKINQVSFSDLDKTTAPDAFVQPFRLEVSLESSYVYIVELMQFLSKPSPQFSFLTVSDITLSLGTQPDTVIARLQLVGHQIQPNGSLESKVESTQNSNYQTVPVWERY